MPPTSLLSTFSSQGPGSVPQNPSTSQNITTDFSTPSIKAPSSVPLSPQLPVQSAPPPPNPVKRAGLVHQRQPPSKNRKLDHEVEDTNLRSARKTPCKEFICPYEAESLTFDSNLYTHDCAIQALETVQRKINRMSNEGDQNVRLDDDIDATSFSEAIKGIYGDKAPDILNELKENPSVAVPCELKTLQVQHGLWEHAQRKFNEQWKEDVDRYKNRSNNI